MQLRDFISKALEDIHNGLEIAKKNTNRDYAVEASGGGVKFDVAVTTITTTESEIEGKATAGLIEVLGAGVKGKLDAKSENSEVSRIQFNINVPATTTEEDAEFDRKIMQSNSEAAEKWGSLR